ncbi:MAG: tRNA lysidine(34) synthetase TilS [Clostridiales bacterium]|nr:tRNA lysidine(34) synthetase TilS [Clostridiales bacterium]
MQNRLLKFAREQNLIAPGDTVICAVSGGADSVAMLFALYLLREKLGITLEAAHFNHNLRGEESLRDETFVRELCARYEIPLHAASGEIHPGKKGLEAAARDARYAFLESLPGKIATAHTADDNAETVLMHLVRGTGLKGLGGIAPQRGKLIRPMLGITRREVEDFLAEWHLPHVEDSTNETDAFLRNRLRHHVMPLLAAENPRIAENLSQMALRLREDEACLSQRSRYETLPEVETLRTLPSAVRSRMLERFLKENGVREPEDVHIAQAEALVFSESPSASAAFPGGVTLSRRYGHLTANPTGEAFTPVTLTCPGSTEAAGIRITCEPAGELAQSENLLTVCPSGKISIRPRQTGDKIRLSGGSKSLKKLFIDRKIPAAVRERIPVVCDETGILGVYSIGVNLERAAQILPAVTIRFERIQGETENAQ